MTMSPREEELYNERLAKLKRLRDRGIDPYPARFERNHTSTAAIAAFEASEAAGSDAPSVTVAGRLTALRRMGKAAFLDLQDGEGRIQVFARADNLNETDFETLKDDVDLGDILGASGPLIRTRSGEISVQAEAVTMLAKSLQTPPEKFHGLTDTEQRYRQRYRDLIANEDTRELFRLRSRVVSAVRRFLEDRGFMEVETPILTEQSGGAAARPFKTHHNTLDRDLYLRIATELHLKRLIVGGFDKVYEIGRIFRNEGLSWKHSPEYTMLESYEAYAGYEDVMRMLEEMVAAVAQECLGTTRIRHGEEDVELTPPWRRLPLRQALIEYAGLDPEAYRDIEALKTRLHELGVEPEAGAGWGKLIDQVQSEFVEPKLVQPTFLLDYPVELSPLAKQKPADERYVERFEAFCIGFEVANAYSELNDPLEQRRRFVEQARLREAGDEETEGIDEDYLTALEHGMPPTGGLGVGIDRLVMLLSGRHNIREVILFPTLRERQ
jgi:lysyl-tRNA synthetase class 2